MWKILRIVSKGDYLYAYVPNHPNATKKGYVLEHRVVMENHIGRLLTDDEIIHHKDENKKNNSIDNLELLTRSKHTALHSKEPEVVELICSYCNSSFLRRANQRPSAKGYTQSFCSRSCNGKYQRSKQLASVSPLASNQMKG